MHCLDFSWGASGLYLLQFDGVWDNGCLCRWNAKNRGGIRTGVHNGFLVMGLRYQFIGQWELINPVLHLPSWSRHCSC